MESADQAAMVDDWGTYHCCFPDLSEYADRCADGKMLRKCLHESSGGSPCADREADGQIRIQGSI